MTRVRLGRGLRQNMGHSRVIVENRINASRCQQSCFDSRIEDGSRFVAELPRACPLSPSASMCATALVFVDLGI